jgi:hypothetical protein
MAVAPAADAAVAPTSDDAQAPAEGPIGFEDDKRGVDPSSSVSISSASIALAIAGALAVLA